MAVNLLVSFAYCATQDVSQLRASMPCGRIMLDSGAFTASTSGRPVNLDDYARFLDTWPDVFDHSVTLDVIGDPAATKRNTFKLHGMGHNVMPVFTRGEKVAEFDAMVRDSGYVCVGGGVGMSKTFGVPRMAMLQRRAEDMGGGIHALGISGHVALAKIRPYSCDSSRVSIAFKLGYLLVYTRTKRVVVVPITGLQKHARPHWSALRDQGIDLAPILRAGRMPTMEDEPARSNLAQAMSVTFLCMDEDTAAWGVPVPTGVDDTPGCHLYSAAGNDMGIAVSHLDTLAHDDAWTVPLWTAYRHKHARQCRVKLHEETPA